MNAIAFGKLNPFGAQLNAIYSSDIGHFDVIDMREPLPEAYELVEDGHHHGRQFPRLRLHQRGDAVGHAEPRLLQGHAGREGSRRGAQGGAAAGARRRREVAERDRAGAGVSASHRRPRKSTKRNGAPFDEAPLFFGELRSLGVLATEIDRAVGRRFHRRTAGLMRHRFSPAGQLVLTDMGLGVRFAPHAARFVRLIH